MAYEHTPGTGSLFKNRDKNKTERSPNMKGTALLELPDGNTVLLDIGAWTREPKQGGDKYQFLTVKIKDQQTKRDNHSAQFAPTQEAQDPDIPFVCPWDIDLMRRLPRV